MNQKIIKIKNVSKVYKKISALEGVSMEIEKGKIYGFIGQNGAGKTTLMRILTGLSFPTSGSIEIFNGSSQGSLEKARKNMGCMIENVSMYPNLTAKENLKFHALLKGIIDQKSIDSVLEMVGLKNTGRKKFKDFSLGMKQRLGIGAALLGNPEILILDEPINGLDPMGILEVRNLLSSLNKNHGMTLLISSHILTELYMLATDYIIIHQGKIVDSITLDQLSEKCKKHITLQGEDKEKIKGVLKSHLKIDAYDELEGGRISFVNNAYDRKALAKVFYDQGLILTELSYSDESLESYFINTIGGQSNDAIN